MTLKITISPSEDFALIDGVPVRTWKGATAGGVPLHAYVCGLIVAEEHQAAFEAEAAADLGATIEQAEHVDVAELRPLGPERN